MVTHRTEHEFYGEETCNGQQRNNADRENIYAVVRCSDGRRRRSARGCVAKERRRKKKKHSYVISPSPPGRVSYSFTVFTHERRKLSMRQQYFFSLFGSLWQRIVYCIHVHLLRTSIQCSQFAVNSWIVENKIYRTIQRNRMLCHRNRCGHN